jgi:hypothetical protein
MLLTVCFETGRQTLTHTSWTGLRLGSRKWMSGQAAALVARTDRRLLSTLIAVSALRESSPLSESRPPSPLDFYLSWMSQIFPPACKDRSAGRFVSPGVVSVADPGDQGK